MKPPIFVIGNPRSGTTLLRLMLTCHSNICVPPESGWLIHLYSKYRQSTWSTNQLEAFVDDLLAVPKTETWRLDKCHVLKYLQKSCPRTYTEVATLVYQYYIDQNQPGKNRFGDKNNFYIRHIQIIKTIYPDALFLHIIRDGRDVACSYRGISQKKEKYTPNLPKDICSIAYEWTKNEQRIQRDLQNINPVQVHHVRYEELALYPQDVLQNICNFIDEPYEEGMLTFDKANRENFLEPDLYMGWKRLTKQPLTPTRVGRWKQELAQGEQFLFHTIAGKQLKDYQYVLDQQEIRLLPRFILASYAKGFAVFRDFAKIINRPKKKILNLILRFIR